MIEELFKDISVTKIFGTAGAGKTTKLIEIVDDLLKSGVEPERIAFCSFTKKAVDEMVARILTKYKNKTDKNFPYFKTIHALCYASSSNKKIMGYKDFSFIANSLGLKISYAVNPEDCGGDMSGDKVVTIESLSRLRMVELEKQWNECGFVDIPLYLVYEWKRCLNLYKKDKKMIDFTDLLENYKGGQLPVDYIIIDEAQDLAPLQWKILNIMAQNCKKVFIAGDDDQLIYKWAGADVDYILGIKNEEEIILSKSHRLPSNIYHLTRDVLKRIRVRKAKECEPTKEDGNIIRLQSIDDLQFKNDENYLILIRNKFLNFEISESLKSRGLPFVSFGKSSIDDSDIKTIYIWENYRKTKSITATDFLRCSKLSSFLGKFDKNNLPTKYFEFSWFEIFDLLPKNKIVYYRTVLSKGYKLNKEPNIKISTIHQAKGGESDNVIVFTDVTQNTWKNINSDDEHRVWYVAISRSRKNLYIINGQSTRYYKI